MQFHLHFLDENENENVSDIVFVLPSWIESSVTMYPKVFVDEDENTTWPNKSFANKKKKE